MAKDLLNKCLHGKTQNSNKPLNGLIWSKLTKTVFVCTKPIEISVNSDVSHFNDGRKSVF